MKHLTAKIMISLACAIILLHAVVPHHHHDCADEEGFVFETELACHCDCDHDHDGCGHSHSHHPFDTCKLAEMLSHLVLSTKEDEAVLASSIKADVHDLFGPMMAPLSASLSEVLMTGDRPLPAVAGARLPQAPCMEGCQLRGPPAVA